MKLKLLLKTKSQTQTLSLDHASSYTIGRKDADVVVDDPRCSKAHALLFEGADGSLRVKDLNSSNGTSVNGTKISESAVGVGDEIHIGSALLVALECDA